MLSSRSRIVPVEVKAGKTGTLKSLHYFMHTHTPVTLPGIAVRMDLTPRSATAYDERGNFMLLHIPLFMAEKTYAILNAVKL